MPAEVGQLLGVQFMINGSIGKIGDKYTIDVKMFSVETGATERTVNATHEGDIAGLLTEMQILAWEIVGLQAPRRLRLQRGGETDKPTVAVLDFEGRGISVMEAQTLTDRFTTSMSSTDRVQLVERGVMSEVLEEQGMTGAECTSQECAAEVGAMLGVQFMVNGAIGKLGDTYTIDVKMFSVATGAAESMKSVTYAGKVDGLIVEIELLAWTALGLDPPKSLIKKQRRFAEGGQMSDGPQESTNWMLWGGIGLAVLGGAAVALGGGDAGGDISGGGGDGGGGGNHWDWNPSNLSYALRDECISRVIFNNHEKNYVYIPNHFKEFSPDYIIKCEQPLCAAVGFVHDWNGWRLYDHSKRG